MKSKLNYFLYLVHIYVYMWFLFISIKMNELGLQGGLKHFFFWFLKFLDQSRRQVWVVKCVWHFRKQLG